MFPYVVAMFVASEARADLLVDADPRAPVTLEAVVEGDTLELVHDGRYLSDFEDTVEVSLPRGQDAVAIEILAPRGWSLEVRGWEATDRGVIGFFGADDVAEIVLIAVDASGEQVQYGPVLKVKPKG